MPANLLQGDHLPPLTPPNIDYCLKVDSYIPNFSSAHGMSLIELASNDGMHLQPGFHIVVSVGDTSQSLHR